MAFQTLLLNELAPAAGRNERLCGNRHSTTVKIETAGDSDETEVEQTSRQIWSLDRKATMRPRAREMLSSGARDFAGEIPLILKTNDNNVLREEKNSNQALTASVQDTLRPGCCPDEKLLDEIRSIHVGGGVGSIINRNSFQRWKEEATRMLVVDIYASPAASARKCVAQNGAHAKVNP